MTVTGMMDTYPENRVEHLEMRESLPDADELQHRVQAVLSRLRVLHGGDVMQQCRRCEGHDQADLERVRGGALVRLQGCLEQRWVHVRKG